MLKVLLVEEREPILRPEVRKLKALVLPTSSFANTAFPGLSLHHSPLAPSETASGATVQCVPSPCAEYFDVCLELDVAFEDTDESKSEHGWYAVPAAWK